ncbi:PD-(D/E)XK nuclease family protein [Corynebacterium sp.]|jgi:ATP-dependent helicase/nuclease subunit B|uniref:PD-(D/E)XK nuclease family protein n=2 Tax=Corynebacterium TaxID=1716 RepID=UPI0025C35925|nr:PD-(D/E)XK nuclease family protein [Corynebacterium sp.]
MHITFGWGFDTARWTTATTPATLGSVVTGPTGLADILATRLALTRPDLDRSTRIAAYRSALSQVVATAAPGSWPATGFSHDPWTVARELLAWRDQLVSAGWNPTDTAGTDTPERLGVLVRVEALLPTTAGWAPGPADTLRTIGTTLADLVTNGTDWPLGIDAVALDHPVNDLPPLWRRILSNLIALGVPVAELPEPAPLTELTVLTADTEWDAAPAVARLLTDLEAAEKHHTVLAGRSTQLLDRELLRLGGTPVGVGPRGVSPLAQVIPVFLRAVTAPHDVSALADLLNVTVPGIDEHSTFPLLPGALRRTLIDALSQEPGVGGPAWTTAVNTTLDGAGPEDAQSVREFDELIRLTPLTDDNGLDTSLVAAHLGWLGRQFQRFSREDNEPARVTTLIATVSTLVAGLGSTISSHELDQVVAEVTGTGGLRVHAEASAARDTVTSPGQLGTGTAPVIWWLPVDEHRSVRELLRPAESAWLENAGVVLPDPESLARLTLRSELRALRRRRKVTAVLPARIDGERAAEHAALTFLINDLPREADTTFDDLQKSTREDATLPADRAHVPDTLEFCIPDPVSRTVTGGEHLIPTRISYSQWEKLLVHPLEWLLDRRLGIRAGGLVDVPTGNRMVGTWLHATVENIVNRRLDENNGDPVTVYVTEQEVTGELEALLPAYASELALPGRSRDRGATIALAVRSITGLFTALEDAGIRVRAVEAEFETTLTGSHGRDGEPLVLGGFRDMDVIMADGSDGVIDLKYTLAKKKYRDAVANGTALQLAVYAASVAGTGKRLADVPVAYFSLHDDLLHTADPRFGLGEDTLDVSVADGGAPTADELWDRAVTGLNRILDDLRAGHLTDLGNLLVLQDADPDGNSPEGTTEETRAALAAAGETGYLPAASAKYTDLALVTGVEGDRA